MWDRSLSLYKFGSSGAWLKVQRSTQEVQEYANSATTAEELYLSTQRRSEHFALLLELTDCKAAKSLPIMELVRKLHVRRSLCASDQYIQFMAKSE